ncbi:MAG TPA: response regulator [Devosiaceae bacterium]|nr:response regulator [Devosiaceae bacterium]
MLPRLLICEDDFLIASDLASTLSDCGATIVGFAAEADKALELAQRDTMEVDAAILDIRLGGELAYPVARALLDRGVGVVFYSGYSDRDVPVEFAAVPFVSKPADAATILQALQLAR